MNWIISILNLLFQPKKISPVIPVASPNEVLLLEAENWVGTIEKGGDNCGPEVEMFQHAINSHPSGESWCMSFVQFCVQQVEKKLNIKSNIYRSEWTVEVWKRSPASMRLLQPEVGCVVIWEHGETGQGHCGIIENVADEKTITIIEGNTGPGEKSEIVRNGDGVYRRIRSQLGTFEMRILGYLKVF